MAAYTSAGNGNWSAAGTWTVSPPAGGPGSGDTVTIAHNVTIDLAAGAGANGAVSIGTSASSNTAITMTTAGKTLTVVTGASVTLLGNVSMTGGSAITWAFQHGTTLTFAPPSTFTYSISIADNGIITFAGTSGSHCTVTTTQGGGNNGFMTGSGIHSGQVAATYTDFSFLGASAQACMGGTLSGGTDTFSLDHCTLDNCGAMTGSAANTCTVSVTNCTWTNSLGTSCSIPGSNGALTTGTRLCSGNIFDVSFGASGAYLGFTFTGNFFGNAFAMSGTNPWASFTGNFIRNRSAGSVVITCPGSVTNSYLVFDIDGATKVINPHGLQAPTAITSNFLFDSNIADGSTTDGNGDCFFLNTAPASPFTSTMQRNITVPCMDGSNPGTLITILGNSNNNTNNSIVMVHNTSYAGFQGPSSCETTNLAGVPAGILTFKANLIWSDSLTTGCKYKDTSALNPTNVSNPTSNTDYNSGFNLALNAGTNRFTNDGKGYGQQFADTNYGLHDADVLAGSTCALNPVFAEPTNFRNFARWGQSVGQSGANPSATLWNNTLAYLQTNLAVNIPALMAWVQAGYRPTATTLKAASYPADPLATDAAGNTWLGSGPDIGAMAWQPVTLPSQPTFEGGFSVAFDGGFAQ